MRKQIIFGICLALLLLTVANGFEGNSTNYNTTISFSNLNGNGSSSSYALNQSSSTTASTGSSSNYNTRFSLLTYNSSISCGDDICSEGETVNSCYADCYEAPEEAENNNGGSSGGSSGGSGGGSGGVASSANPSMTHIISQITPGISASLDIRSDAIDIKKIVIEAKEIISNARITISQENDKINSTTAPNNNEIISYLLIVHDNINDDQIEQVTYTIRAPTSSTGEYKKIKFWKKTDDEFKNIPLKYSHIEDGFYYFTAVSSGLSVYIITKEKNAQSTNAQTTDSPTINNSTNNPEIETPQTTITTASCEDNIKNQGEEDTDCGGPCDSCKKNSMYGYVLALIALITLAVALTTGVKFIRTMHPKQPEKHNQLSPENQLKKYVQEQQLNGFSIQSIKTKLITAGWNINTINKAIQEINDEKLSKDRP